MTDTLYDVVYVGEIIAPDRGRVAAEFARLFRIDEDSAGRILAASRRVLKKGLTRDRAQHYARRLSDIGVLVQIEPRAPDPEAVITLEPDDEAPTDTATAGGAGATPPSEPPSGPDTDAESSASGWEGIDADQLRVEAADGPRQRAVNFAAIEDTRQVKRMPLRFTGNGAAFFRIWIVNIGLSLVTLGIYSAWAKVRTLRYFYGHTWLDGAAFEYLAEPLAILRGRIIAVLLLLAYALSHLLFPPLAPVLGLVVLVALPWVVVQSLRFRRRNTAYRQIRFGFDGSLWGAAGAYPLMLFLVPLSFFLLLPYMLFAQSRFRVGNTRYGTDMFSFNVAAREYYRIYLVALLGLLAATLVSAMASVATPILGALVALAAYSLVISYVQVETINTVFDNTQLGDHRLSAQLELWPYFNLFFVNAVLMILTLGLFYPWAWVRMTRYRIDNLLLLAQGSINHYVATQEEEVGAVGEETGYIFDFDIGF